MVIFQSKIIHHQIFGLPIVEAVELEKEQIWSGCAIHESVIQHVGHKLIGLDYTMLIPYEIPLKNKKLEPLLAVNWAYTFFESDLKNISSQKIRDSFSSHGKNTNNINSLINNTVAFFEAMKHYNPTAQQEVFYD